MKKQQRALIISYLGFIVLGLNDGMLGIAWPGIRNTFGRSNESLGILLGGFTTGYIVASLLNGTLIKRYGLATSLIASTLMMGLGSWLFSLSTGFAILIAFAASMGAGMALLDAGANTYAAANFRPRLLNWMHACFAVGTMCGTALMTATLNNNFEWRVGFMIAGSIYLMMLLPYLLTRKDWQIDNFTNATEKSSDITPLDTLRQPVVLLLLLVFLLYVSLEIGFGNWIFTILTESRGISTVTAGTWVSLYWGSFAIGRIVLGFIETNVVRVIRYSIAGIFFGLLIWWLNPGEWANFVGLAIIGFSNASVFPGLVALTPALVGNAHTPNAIGFQLAASGIGAAVIPGIAGLFADWSTLEIIPLFFLFVAATLFGTHEILARKQLSPPTVE